MFWNFLLLIETIVISVVQPPKFEFYDPKTPFYTSPRFLPPTKIDKCRVCWCTLEPKFWLHCVILLLMFLLILQIVDTIISHGCFLRECTVQHSVVGERSRLDYGVELKVIYHNFLNCSDFSLTTWLGDWETLFCTFSGYSDAGSRLLPNWSWNCISSGWGESPNWCWKEHKNQVLDSIFKIL